MNALEFDQKLRERLLAFRQRLNKAAQCMNFANQALDRSATACAKADLRLRVSSQRLANCMRAHGL